MKQDKKSIWAPYRIYGVFLIVVFVAPIFIESKYFLNVLVFCAIHTIIVVGYSIFFGYAGQISLGHAAFYGLGAYCSGVLTVKFGYSPWTALGIGIVLTAIVSFIIGLPTLKLKGHYLAMATLAFAIIIQILFIELDFLTEGNSGLVGIPEIAFFGIPINTDIRYYYFAWTFALVIILFSLNLVDSRVGRALRALNDKELGAKAMGVNTEKYKIQIFVLSAVYASVAGSLYTHYITFLSPEGFGFHFSILILIMVTFGGLGSIWGGVIGAVSLTILPELLRAYKDFDIIAYGVILIIFMMFMPKGIVGLLSSIKAKSNTLT
jgi:branched-chain amino acid transport system permease protein